MRRVCALLILLGLAPAACASGSATPTRAAATATRAVPAALPSFSIWRHVKRPLDFSGPRPGRSVVLAAAGRLWRLNAAGRITLFASAYDRPSGTEPYIANAAGCFGTDTVDVLQLFGTRGVLAVTPGHPVRLLARITAPGLIDGIAYDAEGDFGHRLLVTITHGTRTTVDAIDCGGRVSTLTTSAPRVEGGLVVAGAGLGPDTGDLIAPDERSGLIYAITPAGTTHLMVRSGLSFGPDTGVESEVQIPNAGSYAVLGADRLNPGNRHPGDDALLRIGSAALGHQGVRGGDLMAGTEGGARLVDVHCSASACTAREVAVGPARAHLEGHLAIAPR